MDREILPYNPGDLPTKPSPQAGEFIKIDIDGFPPNKDTKFSIRNREHKNHKNFENLRQESINSMRGRAWTFNAVSISVIIYHSDDNLPEKLNSYLGGIMDTLGGSSGDSFTYLPIFYEDDKQVIEGNIKSVKSKSTSYQLSVGFL